jgi:hypothetical protein
MRRILGSLFGAVLGCGFAIPADAVLMPLEVGQLWAFVVTDTRTPCSPWIEYNCIGGIEEIASHPYYVWGRYNPNTGHCELSVFVDSDDENVYLWDDGVYKVWPLASMVPEHVVVPYGEFDAYYYDEGDWYNYFVPGLGLVKNYQIEGTYTVTSELVLVPEPDAPAVAIVTIVALYWLRRRKNGMHA